MKRIKFIDFEEYVTKIVKKNQLTAKYCIGHKDCDSRQDFLFQK